MEEQEIWNKEPDVPRLEAAYDLVHTDSRRALAELEALVNRGSVMSLVYIGSMFARGIGTAVDLAKAEQYYSRAAERGSTTALLALGGIFWDASDFKKAAEQFEIGASRGDPRSMYWLARVHLRGKNRESLGKALKLLEQASSLGHLQSEITLGRQMSRGRFGAKYIFAGFWRRIRAASLAGKMAVDDPTNRRLRDLVIDPQRWKNQ